MPKIRRALLTVSDKDQLVPLGKALEQSGAEIVATGRTAKVLAEAGIQVVPIEQVSGSPEAFKGRMKTLSFNVCSGILFRRGDDDDQKDLEKLNVKPIDCVVVNFYPFEKTVQELGQDPSRQSELVEQIDIGGPTLVRAAAKNSPDVLVLTDPSQYPAVIDDLEKTGAVKPELAADCARLAWEKIYQYDRAIYQQMSLQPHPLRYGENPHQKAELFAHRDSPVAWPVGDEPALTKNALSYNNILDFTAAYDLASELNQLSPRSNSVVIVKHNNPCGVASVPMSLPGSQKQALMRAWEGDPVSAFGGVLVFSQPLTDETAEWLADKFVEFVAAPELTPESSALQTLLKKRKKLKAVKINRLSDGPVQSLVRIPGGELLQTIDRGLNENFESVTEIKWPEDQNLLGKFGVAVCRALKSNTIALVRNIPELDGAMQLVGAGQGQPNRVEALEKLAVPRAKEVLQKVGGQMGECIMVSDAFFPFRDTVDVAARAGIRWIIQPGGSVKDKDSIAACNEHQMGMVFTGTRHFKH